MLLYFITSALAAGAVPGACDRALANDRNVLERLSESHYLSTYRARFTTIQPATPVAAPWRRRLTGLDRHRYVAALGPGPSNTVYRVDGDRVREVFGRKTPGARMRTADGDLIPGPAGWIWAEGAPAWYGAPRLDRAAVLAHFAAPLHHLVAEMGLLTLDELEHAKFERAAHDGRDLVYVQINRRGGRGFLLLDVNRRSVFSEFEQGPESSLPVTISNRARLRAERGDFLTVPAEGWAARVAPGIADPRLRTLFERFGPEVDAVFLEPDPPASSDLVRARVSAVTGQGEWRPYVALRLRRRTLYFDPRTRRWVDEAEARGRARSGEAREDIGNEDLPTPGPSLIHSDSATFGP